LRRQTNNITATSEKSFICHSGENKNPFYRRKQIYAVVYFTIIFLLREKPVVGFD